MTDRLCRPCRELARRQLRALIELNHAPRASVASIANHARRSFHQSAAFRSQNPPQESSGFRKVMAQVATSLLPARAVQPYLLFGATEQIYKACSEPAMYKISEELRKQEEVPLTENGEEIGVSAAKDGSVWHQEFGLLPTFQTWSSVTMLHLYLVVVRLRCLERPAWQAWQNQLVNHFFHHAEEVMAVNHGMTSRMVRAKYINDLFLTWRGALLAYDEGFVKGDAVMAAAVWRIVYQSREDVDMRHVAAIVSWMRRTLKSLDQMLEPQLLYHGANVFTRSPAVELQVVDSLTQAEDSQ